MLQIFNLWEFSGLLLPCCSGKLLLMSLDISQQIVHAFRGKVTHLYFRNELTLYFRNKWPFYI